MYSKSRDYKRTGDYLEAICVVRAATFRKRRKVARSNEAAVRHLIEGELAKPHPRPLDDDGTGPADGTSDSMDKRQV